MDARLKLNRLQVLEQESEVFLASRLKRIREIQRLRLVRILNPDRFFSLLKDGYREDA